MREEQILPLALHPDAGPQVPLGLTALPSSPGGWTCEERGSGAARGRWPSTHEAQGDTQRHKTNPQTKNKDKNARGAPQCPGAEDAVQGPVCMTPWRGRALGEPLPPGDRGSEAGAGGRKQGGSTHSEAQGPEGCRRPPRGHCHCTTLRLPLGVTVH